MQYNTKNCRMKATLDIRSMNATLERAQVVLPDKQHDVHDDLKATT